MSEDTNPGAEEAAGGYDFDQAVAALEAKSQQATNPPEEPDDKVDEAPSDETEPVEDSPEEDQADTDEDENDAADPEEAEDDAEEEDEESDDAPTPVSDEAVVQLGEETLTVAELRNGYLREADYTRKAQEAASLRSQSEQTLEGLDQYATDIQVTLDKSIALMDMVHAQLKPPDVSLRDTNPAEYAAGWTDYQQAMQQLTTLYAEVEQKRDDTQAISQAHRQNLSARELEERQQRLHKAVPELADPTKRDSVLRDVAEVGQSVGFSVEEISAWSDERFAHLAVLAAHGRKAKAKVPAAKKKLAGAPKVSKPITRRSNKSVQREKVSQAEQRLKQVGTYEAAEEALRARRTLR